MLDPVLSALSSWTFVPVFCVSPQFVFIVLGLCLALRFVRGLCRFYSWLSVGFAF